MPALFLPSVAGGPASHRAASSLRWAAWRRWARPAGHVALLLALVAAPLWLGRQVLVHHLAERQAQGLQALSRALSTLPGPLDARVAALVAGSAGAIFEVSVADDHGRLLAQWRQAHLSAQAPAAFVAALAMPKAPAVARAEVEGQPLQLQLRAGVGDLADLLWALLLAWLAASMALVTALAAWLRRTRMEAEAAATASTARLVQREQALFDAQAEQLEALRRQAHTDPLTGLSNRRHFIAGLEAFLAAQGEHPRAGLLLLRVRDLPGLNQRLGHGSTDRLLQALALTLCAYPQRINHCAAGRLNGADFALLLPATGLADETADCLLCALRQTLGDMDPQASVAIGAMELDRRLTAAQALALADAALAEAEVQGGFAAATAASPPVMGEDAGEATWQRRITRALDQGRTRLGEYPVCTPDGRQLLLDCPLRVQFTTGGPFEPAQRWRALATRSGLNARVDEKALSLALAAITRDGVARCVNLSGESLASPEFIATVTRRLQSAPEAASRLWIDLPEALALERPMLVREVAQRWQPLGPLLGLEHAGEGLLRIPRLIDLGLHGVRIDARFVNGISDPAAGDARRYLQGLVRLVQSVGMQASAEGVRQAADLDALWALGFDAATGPAVLAAQAALQAEEPVAAEAAAAAELALAAALNASRLGAAPAATAADAAKPAQEAATA